MRRVLMCCRGSASVWLLGVWEEGNGCTLCLSSPSGSCFVRSWIQAISMLQGLRFLPATSSTGGRDSHGRGLLDVILGVYRAAVWKCLCCVVSYGLLGADGPCTQPPPIQHSATAFSAGGGPDQLTLGGAAAYQRFLPCQEHLLCPC